MLTNIAKGVSHSEQSEESSKKYLNSSPFYKLDQSLPETDTPKN